MSARRCSPCAGRMLIGQGAIDACKIGVTIATRYACARPQFGSQFIMGYLTHQRRLLPALACAYGLHLTMLRLKVRCDGLAGLQHLWKQPLHWGVTTPPLTGNGVWYSSFAYAWPSHTEHGG